MRKAAIAHQAGLPCPLCGHWADADPPPPPKTRMLKARLRAAPEISPPDSALTDAARRAHYRRTAPYEDVRFALRIDAHLSPALRADWQALLEAVPTFKRTKVYRRLVILQDRWRQELPW